jgi:hypothetical protein
MTGPTPCNSNISKLQQEHLLLTPGQAILMQIDPLEPLLLVMQAERRELRLAVSRAAVCARSSNSACCLASNVDAAFVALLAAHVPLVHDAALALRLSRRPLRQAAAPLQRAGVARRAPQRLAAQRDRFAHAHPGLLRARLVAAALRERLSRRQRAVCRLAQLFVAARRRLPTRSRSGTACRRARLRCRFTASGWHTMRRPRSSSTAATSSIRRAARCSTTTRSRSRGRWRWRRAPTFVLVQPSELISRAWMKDAADAHTRHCPNIKRIIKPVQPHQPLGGVGNSAQHRRPTDAPQHAQALHRAGTLLPRRAEPARACSPSTSSSTSGPCSGLKGLWEKLPTKWEKRNAELDLFCNPKSNSGRDARAAVLRARNGRGRRLTMRACST